MAETKSGYIYVLTNESFHRENWIKIGYAEDVEKRVKELSGTAVPLPYEVYCTYEIPRISGVKDPDKLVHDLIQTLNLICEYRRTESSLNYIHGMLITCSLPLHRCMRGWTNYIAMKKTSLE